MKSRFGFLTWNPPWKHWKPPWNPLWDFEIYCKIQISQLNPLFIDKCMVILRLRKKSIPPPPQWMIIGNSKGEGGFISKGCLAKSPFQTSLGEGGGGANQRVFCGGCGVMDIFWKYIFQIPWKIIFRFWVQRSWETISDNFLVPWKSMKTHLLNVFNFFKSYIFSWHWKP